MQIAAQLDNVDFEDIWPRHLEPSQTVQKERPLDNQMIEGLISTFTLKQQMAILDNSFPTIRDMVARTYDHIGLMLVDDEGLPFVLRAVNVMLWTWSTDLRSKLSYHNRLERILSSYINILAPISTLEIIDKDERRWLFYGAITIKELCHPTIITIARRPQVEKLAIRYFDQQQQITYFGVNGIKENS